MKNTIIKLILAVKYNILSLFSGKRLSKPVTVGLMVAILSVQLLLPQARAKVSAQETYNIFSPIDKVIEQFEEKPNYANSFPVAEDAPLWKIKVPMTAYNSLPAQTDSTPCITANGYNLCEANEENVVAANFLPLGSKVKIPELYGDREFTVVDRMNKRYYYKMDIWMREYTDAKKFGVKYATVEVYSYN